MFSIKKLQTYYFGIKIFRSKYFSSEIYNINRQCEVGLRQPYYTFKIILYK